LLKTTDLRLFIGLRTFELPFDIFAMTPCGSC
jgi:hypothetical protein